MRNKMIMTILYFSWRRQGYTKMHRTVRMSVRPLNIWFELSVQAPHLVDGYTSDAISNLVLGGMLCVRNFNLQFCLLKFVQV